MNTKTKTTSGRWKYVVGLVLLPALALTGFFLLKKTGNSPAASEEQLRIPVVVTHPITRNFEKLVTTQGNLEAKNFAVVSSRIPGPIENIFVDEGDTVIQGQTKLFEIDSVKLTKALEISKLDIAVAESALREKQANLERTEADFNKAELDYDRFKRLFEKEAVAADALEQQQSRY